MALQMRGQYGIYFDATDNLDAVIRENGDITGFDDNGLYCDCRDDLTFDISKNGDITGGSYGIYFPAKQHQHDDQTERVHHRLRHHRHQTTQPAASKSASNNASNVDGDCSC